MRKILQVVATNTVFIQDFTANESYYSQHQSYKVNENTEMGNATTQNNKNMELLKMMQNLQNELHQTKIKLNSNNTNLYQQHTQEPPTTNTHYSPWGRPQGRGQGGRGRSEVWEQTRRKNTRFYCWTYGTCVHAS